MMGRPNPLPPSRRGRGQGVIGFNSYRRKTGTDGMTSTRQRVPIVRAQRVAPAKVAAARTLRRRMTPAETAPWQALRRNAAGGLHFRRQQVVDGLIADFFYSKAGLTVEVDGPIHDAQESYDRERDNLLVQRGLTVLHVRNDEVFDNLPDVLARIIKSAGPDSKTRMPTGRPVHKPRLSPLSASERGRGRG